MKNNKITFKAHEHQKKVLRSQKYNIFCGCGVGAGKTQIGSLWSVKKSTESHPDSLGIIAANSYPQLLDSTLRNVYKSWADWGLDYYPKIAPKAHRPFSIYLNLPDGRREILCRSLDTYKMWSGMEVNWIWLDETWQTPKEAIEIADARLRDSRRGVLQMLMTTTLDDPSSWMYEQYVENLDEDLTDVIYAPTHANIANLPEGYIDRLKSRYTKEMYDRMVLAKWTMLGGIQIYYAFSRDNVSEDIAKFDENLPIYWTHDFNIGEGKPMSSALCQIKKHGEKPILTVFDEIILESADTNQAVAEFENRRYHKSKDQVIIHGDSSGRSRDTRSNTTDYGIMRDAGFYNQRVPSRNPAIRDRHNAVNALCKNVNDEIRFYVHPKCKTLIKGMETVKLKKGAGYLEEETYSQHVTTAIGYLINEEFPIKQTRMTSARILM